MSKLLDKIRGFLYSKSFRSEGLDQRLDLTPLEHGEFVVFCRKGSMLSAKIDYRLKTRKPEEALMALLALTKRGYCTYCYELCKKCECPTREHWL